MKTKQRQLIRQRWTTEGEGGGGGGVGGFVELG